MDNNTLQPYLQAYHLPLTREQVDGFNRGDPGALVTTLFQRFCDLFRTHTHAEVIKNLRTLCDAKINGVTDYEFLCKVLDAWSNLLSSVNNTSVRDFLIKSEDNLLNLQISGHSICSFPVALLTGEGSRPAVLTNLWLDENAEKLLTGLPNVYYKDIIGAPLISAEKKPDKSVNSKISINMNKKNLCGRVPFKDKLSKKIVCRHMVYRYGCDALNDENAKVDRRKYSERKIIKENIKWSVDYEWDKAIWLSESKGMIRSLDFGRVLQNIFTKMEKSGQTKDAVLIIYNNHALSARLRIKNGKDGSEKKYVVSVYEPNYSIVIRRAFSSSADFSGLSVNDFQLLRVREVMNAFNSPVAITSLASGISYNRLVEGCSSPPHNAIDYGYYCLSENDILRQIKNMPSMSFNERNSFVASAARNIASGPLHLQWRNEVEPEIYRRSVSTVGALLEILSFLDDKERMSFTRLIIASLPENYYNMNENFMNAASETITLHRSGSEAEKSLGSAIASCINSCLLAHNPEKVLQWMNHLGKLSPDKQKAVLIYFSRECKEGLHQLIREQDATMFRALMEGVNALSPEMKLLFISSLKLDNKTKLKGAELEFLRHYISPRTSSV